MIPRAASFKLLLWALGFAAIGLIDLALPPGIAVWVLYLAPIWFASTPRLMVITACISSALLVLVFATTLPGSFSWGVGLNQFIAVLAIWGFTLVVIRYRRGPRSRGETPGSNEISGSLSAESSSAEDMRATKWARAALAMAAVLLGYVGLLVFFNLVGEEQTAKWVEHSYQELQYLKDTHSALKDAETGQRGFLLTEKSSLSSPTGLPSPRLTVICARSNDTPWTVHPSKKDFGPFSRSLRRSSTNFGPRSNCGDPDRSRKSFAACEPTWGNI